jgi:ribonuclease HII
MCPRQRASVATDRLAFERQVLTAKTVRIAGVDEAGRGPIAGPVVAAAVVLPPPWLKTGVPAPFAQLNDSKQLSETARTSFFEDLTTLSELHYSVASIEAREIDSINILRATRQAMLEALHQLRPPPDHVLVDGLRVPDLPWPQTPIVKGDARSYSIAAASVIAKVTRDRLMHEHDQRYPGYGFAQHKGYGTTAHLHALRQLGPCPIHRRSFAPLKPAQGELLS